MSDKLCPNCQSSAVTEAIVTSTFDYGCKPHPVIKVSVTEPVMACGDCGEEWTDYRGEEARSEAVIKALYTEVKSLLAFKAGVDEALNSGDGSYRP